MESIHSADVPSKLERLGLLSGSPALRGLDDRALEELALALEPMHLAGGTCIVERGQSGVPLFLVVQGGLRASYVDSDGRHHVIFEVFRGGTVGEALVLTGRPSPLDLHAVRDSYLLRLTPEKFNVLSERYPDLILRLSRFVANRMLEVFNSPDFLASFARRTDRLPRSIALLSSSAADVRRMRDLVAKALSRSRSTIRVTVDEARDVLSGRGDQGAAVPHARWLEWLGGLEARSELMLFSCEPSDGAWLDFCLRQADRIMVLLHDEEARRLGKEGAWWREAKLEERSARLELAIVHEGSSALPRGSNVYYQLPGVSRLHHVRAGDTRDAERLARWLLNRPVGLVLGGGGARGIAHVGVLKALEESRVPIDIVGGTSMGAIFAGGHARGWSADDLMERVESLFASRFALFDPTIPLISLLAGVKLDRILRRFFEDIDIADLWTPFFCVSTNISHPHPQVHDNGKLRDAIRSSCSIPGLFPPFQEVRQFLVDGGLVDNLPIDVMVERCGGPIIAVDVFPYRRSGEEAPRRSPRRRAGPLRRLKPRTRWRPVGLHLFDILTRSTLVGSQRTTEQCLSSHPPALYLAPQVTNFRLLDWRAYEALFRAGYVCARQELEAGALPRGLWEGHIGDIG